MKEKLFRMCRSGLAMILALCMIVGMIPGVAFATESEADAEEKVRAALAELQELLEEYGPDAYEAVQNYMNENGYTEALTEALVALKDALEADVAVFVEKTEAAIEVLEAELAALEEELAALKASLEAEKAALEAAIEEADAKSAAAIAAMEAAVAQLEATIETVEAKINAIVDSILNLKQTINDVVNEFVALNDAVVDLDAKVVALIDLLKNTTEHTAEAVAQLYADTRAAAASAVEAVETAYTQAAAVVAAAVELAESAYADGVEAYLFAAEMVAEIAVDLEATYGDAARAAIADFIEEHEAEIAELQAKLEELEAALEEKRPELEEKLAEMEAEIERLVAEATAELEERLPELEAALKEKLAELEAAAEELKPVIEAEIEALRAEIAEIKACIEAKAAEIRAEVEAAYAAVIAEIEAAIAELEAMIAEIEAKIAEVLAEIEAALEQAKAEIEALVAEAKAKIEAAVEALKAHIEEKIPVVEAMIAEAIAQVEAVIADVQAKVEAAVAAFEAAYIRATTDDYAITEDSLYVALGDDSAVSASYVDNVASILGVDYENLAGGTIADAEATIAANAATIAAADLITVGYGNNVFTKAAVDALYNGLNNTAVEFDWAKYVGTEGAAYIEAALAEVEAALNENGLAMEGYDFAGALVMALEAYAYEAVTYATNLPEVVNAIHDVNADAVVVVVGMNNSFEDTTLVVEENKIALGEYLDYMVEAANLHGLIYAMVSGNCIYVAAPNAETDLANRELNAFDFIRNYGIANGYNGNPTAAGHEYITEKILNALNITYVEPEETPEGLFRLKGKDRYITGMTIANEVKALLKVEKFETVVVAYGEKFPDALTGSYLASKFEAPILLTDKKADADVTNYIKENVVAGGKVFILGGEAAVSEAFETGVKALGFQVERLKGSDRYATNLAILNKAGVDADTEILIATGNNYADSLSASATGLPMLLVNKELTAEQKAFLEGTSKKFAILGGTAAVSEEIEAELAAIGEVVRVKGTSRYETSIVIAERYFGNASAAVLAYGENFPDGLCGGPLATLIGAPLVLTHNDKLAAADAYIEGVNYGYVTGGEARLTDATVQEIFDTTAEVVVK